MIDLECFNILCAAFDIAPFTAEQQKYFSLAPIEANNALRQIEKRFAWYAEHCESPLLPHEKRAIALAIAEAHAARGVKK